MNQVFSQEVYIHVLRFALQFFTFNWKQNFAFPNGKYSLTAWYICNIQSCLTRRTAVVLHEMVLKFGQFWNFHDLIGWNENDGRQEFTRIDGSRRKMTRVDYESRQELTRVDERGREVTRDPCLTSVWLTALVHCHWLCALKPNSKLIILGVNIHMSFRLIDKQMISTLASLSSFNLALCYPIRVPVKLPSVNSLTLRLVN